jgi:hypothetical protein
MYSIVTATSGIIQSIVSVDENRVTWTLKLSIAEVKGHADPVEGQLRLKGRLSADHKSVLLGLRRGSGSSRSENSLPRAHPQNGGDGFEILYLFLRHVLRATVSRSGRTRMQRCNLVELRGACLDRQQLRVPGKDGLALVVLGLVESGSADLKQAEVNA